MKISKSTKLCDSCGIIKPFTEFYSRKSKCKICNNKLQYQRKKNKKGFRQENTRKMREYRERHPDIPRKNSLASYYRYRKIILEKRKTEYNIKYKAYNILRNAIRNGIIIKPTKCEKCGAENKRIEGHHCDYSKPLEVKWVCSKCHGLKRCINFQEQ
jgi:hypothetical protein